MSSLRERVEGLVASWRKKADGMDDGTGVTLCAELAQHYRNRADELAAALVAEGQGPATGDRCLCDGRAEDAYCPVHGAHVTFEKPIVGSDGVTQVGWKTGDAATLYKEGAVGDEAVELLRLARGGMLDGPATEQAWRPLKNRIDKFLKRASPAGRAEEKEP